MKLDQKGLQAAAEMHVAVRWRENPKKRDITESWEVASRLTQEQAFNAAARVVRAYLDALA